MSDRKYPEVQYVQGRVAVCGPAGGEIVNRISGTYTTKRDGGLTYTYGGH